MRKRIFLTLLVIAIYGLFTFFNYDMLVSADGVAEYVIETNTCSVVHAVNENAKLPMASTTKIMTALLICEECDLNKVIKVPQEAVGVEGSSVYLKKDEELDIRDLLYGLMLRSGNDCATALAITHSGSVKNFVCRMNAKAKEMGLQATHFTNPSGLPNDLHYTTAKELAIISGNAMKNDVFKEVVCTKSYKGKYRSYTNKNKILNELDGANGIKTGYTLKAGRCLVSSAKRENMDLICVVLNCPDMFARSQTLLNDAFNNNKIIVLNQGKLIVYDDKLYKTPCDYLIFAKLHSTMRYIINEDGDTEKVNLYIYCENDLIFEGVLDSI